MMNQPHALSKTTIMHRLFQGIEHEPCMRRRADTPADNLAGIGFNHEGMQIAFTSAAPSAGLP